MNVDKVYAVITVSDLDRAAAFYEKLFGRGPDASPMAGLHEWHMPEAGIQVVVDEQRAGRAMLTLIVDDLAMIRRLLADRGIVIGESATGEVATIARIDDPDGNVLTFAQPVTPPKV